jgi:hypothetical protein
MSLISAVLQSAIPALATALTSLVTAVPALVESKKVEIMLPLTLLVADLRQ